jgi:hypothetical protein
VRRLGPRPLTLSGLTGLGAPLTVRLGPYNAACEALTAAQQVIDTGLISEAKVEDGALRLHLLRMLEPDAADRVLWWDVHGALHELPVKLHETFRYHCRWSCELPADLPPFIAVALAYEGCRLGAWWQPEWSNLLKNVSTAAPARAAALLRWWRMPLLAADALAAVRAVVAQQPVLYLREWLRDGAQLEALQLGAMTEG